MITSPHRTFAAALAVAALGGTAGLASVSKAPAAAATATRLSIQTEEEGFSGFVRSSRDSCHNGRRVTLYRKSGRRKVRAGSDIAQPNQDGSQWSISVSESGRYYAVVKASRQCKGATSQTLSITL